ncbi:histone deacetylase domain-containing protein [Multifurca ochricompacta]|uniref:Histone deacetylase domain-containing protein n=1 Tax=Multifurca ochricompacta TaxID=376703 RepID=A0AAD4M782_9AGAM|nr:histone deacetylase domain-containing protein [Multifurca ochricompacta]
MHALDSIYPSTSLHYDPVTTIFLQDACLHHKYIRTRDSSHIFERPERLRAVKTGLCAAISRLEETLPVSTNAAKRATDSDTDSLVVAVENLRLEQNSGELSMPKSCPVRVIQSSAKVDILNDPAVKYIHGDIDGDVYLEKLVGWARHSMENISNGQSEIPSELPQVCPTSLDAIQGALGTVCEAVDTIMTPLAKESPHLPHNAFVAVRPPGHHCGEDTPCGFCFVNNVAVGAAHAHLKHGIKRVVILDIDLHHVQKGNGTQSIAWKINDETHRAKFEADAGAPMKPGLQVYYGSVHDILSFPCEKYLTAAQDGKPDMVQAASVSIHGPHGQYIENVHLEPFESEEQFWDEHYRGAYTKLLSKAEDFVKSTEGASDDTFVFISLTTRGLSAGFDASEHETPSMSRHNRRVPTSFFYRFTLDACAFANKWAKGRIVSVLEGGYNDKALLSGAMAHLTGLVDGGSAFREDHSREFWWSPGNVQMREDNETNVRRTAREVSQETSCPISSLGTADTQSPPWFDRTSALLALFDPRGAESSLGRSALIPPSSMTLRARKPANQLPLTNPGRHQIGGKQKRAIPEAKLLTMHSHHPSRLLKPYPPLTRKNFPVWF